MSQARIICHTILRDAFEDFGAPCCASERSLVEHSEDGAEVRQCFACETYFAVIPNVLCGQRMRPGQAVTFTEVANVQTGGNTLTLEIEKHPFDL